MKKSIVIFAILLLGTLLGATVWTCYSISNSQTLTQEPIASPTTTIQPTSNPTVTPQPTAIPPTPPAPTATIIARPSTLNVISPINNATYQTNTIDLTYSVNSKVLWAYYDLDSNEYVSLDNLFKLNNLIPFKGNITLNLSQGPHRLTLSVQTEESRFSSTPIAFQTIDFIINTTSDGSFS